MSSTKQANTFPFRRFGGLARRLRVLFSGLPAHPAFREAKDESTRLKTIAEAFFLPALDEATARPCQRLPGERETGAAVYSREWDIVERANPGLAFSEPDPCGAASGADFAFVWGCGPRPESLPTLAAALRAGTPVVLCEDGFLKSADTWANPSVPMRYRRGCSLVMDSRGFYFDATRPTDIERMLEDRAVVVSDEERRAARRTINRIVREKVTKYNHQPVFTPTIGRPGAKKVLVVDQSYGDFSIRRGLADESTFEKMLSEAAGENPDADILVKTHPDAMTGTRKGYYDGVVQTGRVFRVTMPVNPYSLLELVDKVYVCSTQLGFEALMAGKEVHVYGMPFYAGWGLTMDKLRNPRRTNRRTLEEVFHLFYNVYTRWIDPETGHRWTVDQAIDHLVSLREEYRRSREGS
ncbi:MAG: hypothetical protein IJV65_01980 [Kiritimatiellae bacterium]|nr:hypothetical protein [Kiritimatiellia bacterium]